MTIDIITCEYSPQIGGLSEYTQQIAEGFVGFGHKVRVWTKANESLPLSSGLTEYSDALGKVSPIDIIRLERLWNQTSLRREMFLQWAPTGYGFRAINILFPLWISYRVLRGDTLRVMVHEAFYEWNEPRIHLKLASIVQRLMAALLVNSSREVFVSTAFIARKLRSLRLDRRIPITHLPVPSNILPNGCSGSCQEGERSTTRETFLIGHFGTYNPKVLRILIPILETLLCTTSDLAILLIGAGSERYKRHITPNLHKRINATGTCSLAEASGAIQSCHIMVQPYPEGVSTRRGTAMAALAHGKPLVTTLGVMTEAIWTGRPFIRLLCPLQPNQIALEVIRMARELLLTDLTGPRLDILAFYERHFSISRTLETLAISYAPEHAKKGSTC